MLRRLRFVTSVAFCACVSATSAVADNGRHGLSAFGDLKYPANFAHFGWVNPDAPKGGRLATIGTGALTTFDSFNNFILKGDPAQGLELLFDSLMTRATDEPDAVYGLVARSAELAADGRSVTFELRSEAKFSDGSPLTAEDVAFTFVTLKEKGHPNYRILLRDVAEAQALDRHACAFPSPARKSAICR
jgi:microcin C transport system substrate-binding protein